MKAATAMKVTIFVSHSVSEEIRKSLTAGRIVGLKRDPENPKDPYAVKVMLGGADIGFLANSGKTIVPGTISAATVSSNLAKPKVGDAVAILTESRMYENEESASRWIAEVFWIPAVMGKANQGTDKDGKEYKVGGSLTLYEHKSTVQNAIDDYREKGSLTIKMADNNKGVLVPTVYITSMMDDPKNNPAGCIVDPKPDLLNALNADGTVPAAATKLDGRNGYKAAVFYSSNTMEKYYPAMEKVIRRCALQANELEERVRYMIDQMLPEKIIFAALDYIQRSYHPVKEPSNRYVQTMEENYLTKAMGYYLSEQDVRLIGEKGAGKNTLIETVCWLLNKPFYRIQGNSDMDKIDLLGGLMMKDSTTYFEVSDFIRTLQRGGDVVLDEINGVKPEIALILQSLTDDARSIDIAGYGHVEVHPHSRIWATMNEGYVGTGALNTALADRFAPVILGDLTSITNVLSACVPDAKPEHIAICASLYDTVRKAVADGECTEESVTTRGYIAALKSVRLLPLRTALMDQVGDRPQDPENRNAIKTFIRSAVPA